ncbi:hypothetical protein BKA82DRAFT_1005569 [Pisolithus tinctorius]|uniref:Uncharacterized protein n=1 Tax=Pisolithus tinctorius Marx 270 TaxID=870435 RepID=A0A0C3NRQ5_PISTI|nr:hypothetical protein BKA82DRAFT_1005569 [Pisolithus tinctorius]KIN98205.1 hypothetical protein M404DRAFT_1005569 [Pisolithus tinctorius Marx 270]
MKLSLFFVLGIAAVSVSAVPGIEPFPFYPEWPVRIDRSPLQVTPRDRKCVRCNTSGMFLLPSLRAGKNDVALGFECCKLKAGGYTVSLFL